MNYKLNFSGYEYIEADSVEEAIENFNVDEAYREEEIEWIEEVDEFNISM